MNIPNATTGHDVDIEAMPYPIAHLHKEMREEEDPRIRFRGLIKVFASGLKYVSLICLADYLQNPGSASVNATLAESLRRPSLGHWAAFLRSITKYYRQENRAFHVTQLKQVLKGRTGMVVDHLIHLRNTYVHADVLPSKEESLSLYEDTLAEVMSLLRDFAFVTQYPLIRRDLRSGEETAVMGCDIKHTTETTGQFIVRASDGTDLDVTPFMLLSVDQALPDLLVYETLIGDEAKYIMGNHVRFVSISTESDNRVRLLQNLLRLCATEEEADSQAEIARSRAELGKGLADQSARIQALRTLARKQSEQISKDYINAGRYSARTYVPRKDFQDLYDQFLSSDKTVLFIVADSGVGKSTEICHLYVDRLADDIVWLISGRRTRAGLWLEELNGALFDREDRERWDVGDVLAALKYAPTDERFVILFDGINETDDPVEVFREINEFVNANYNERLKIIVTCRSFAWNMIANSGVVVDRRRYVLSPRGDFANALEPFSDGELASALSLYAKAFATQFPPKWMDRESRHVRKLLRSPLVLRFVFEAYRGRQIPAVIDIETIMVEYTKERIRERDVRFLLNGLMAYFYEQETDLLDTAWLLGLSVDENGLLRPSGYVALIEHICGEQVYEIDTVWICKSNKERCSLSHRPILIDDDEEEGHPHCAECHSPLERENIDNRSTYSRLLSENILSRTELADRSLIRMVFDRYFEYLMRRYLIDKMDGRYDAALIDELFQKTTSNGIFIEPLKAVLLKFAQGGDHGPLYQIARMDHFAAYHVLREVYKEMAAIDFAMFAKSIRTAAERTGFSPNVCRAGVSAILDDVEIASHHGPEVIELLLYLSRCPSEEVHEEAAEYLVTLRRKGLDMISLTIRRSAEAIGSYIGVIRSAPLAFSRRRRLRAMGEVQLFLNTALFGLGNFFDDDAIRGAIVRHGLTIIQTLLRHPLLSLLNRPITRFISQRIARIDKEKGPLPCNYFEMLFQLREDPDVIRRCGDLFFVENQNLFDLSYEEFCRSTHSENGLITWYLLSLLPVHYTAAGDRGRAREYLQRLLREGTEMDRFVVGVAVATLLHGDRNEDLEPLLEAIGEIYMADPSQLFLHPQPLSVIPEGNAVTEYNRNLTDKIRATSNPYAVPWIVLEDGKIVRFYANLVVFQYALLRVKRGRPDRFQDILDVLDRNRFTDVLRVGDVRASRQFVLNFLIGTLRFAAMFGYLKEAFTTLAEIIRVYVDELSDPENVAVYQFAIVDTLEGIKEYHRDAVLGFLDRYDLDRPPHAFLATARTSSVEKESLFNKSLYGHNIYQGAFSTRKMRESFGEFTKRAADAHDVEEFFFIYTRSFIMWLKNYEP
jgi:hypothetical protein